MWESSPTPYRILRLAVLAIPNLSLCSPEFSVNSDLWPFSGKPVTSCQWLDLYLYSARGLIQPEPMQLRGLTRDVSVLVMFDRCASHNSLLKGLFKN